MLDFWLGSFLIRAKHSPQTCAASKNLRNFTELLSSVFTQVQVRVNRRSPDISCIWGKTHSMKYEKRNLSVPSKSNLYLHLYIYMYLFTNINFLPLITDTTYHREQKVLLNKLRLLFSIEAFKTTPNLCALDS